MRAEKGISADAAKAKPCGPDWMKAYPKAATSPKADSIQKLILWVRFCWKNCKNLFEGLLFDVKDESVDSYVRKVIFSTRNR